MKKKSFDRIILEADLPSLSKNYRLEVGKFHIAERLIPSFKHLFRPPGTLKSIGNGEVAVYWLFSNKHGGPYDVTENHGYNFPDLIIDGHCAEVKAHEHSIDGQALKIGRCESSHKIRKIINIVMGVYNVFGVGLYNEKYGDDAYLSEISFGMNGLTRAFDCTIKMYNNGTVKTVALQKMFALKEFAGLIKPEDFAAKTLALLASEKLRKKPGEQGFIINARPDNIGEIEIFKIGELDKVNLDIIKNNGAHMTSSMLRVKIAAFKGGKNA